MSKSELIRLHHQGGIKPKQLCEPYCDVSKSVNVSRAKWLCPKCLNDVSLAYLFWYQAEHPETLNYPLA